LERTHQGNVLEPPQALETGQFVQTGFLHAFVVGHTQLLEALGLAPLLEEPHACIE